VWARVRSRVGRTERIWERGVDSMTMSMHDDCRVLCSAEVSRCACQVITRYQSFILEQMGARDLLDGSSQSRPSKARAEVFGL
jgi:hypothetical protein